jgi:hypothetical protein
MNPLSSLKSKEEEQEEEMTLVTRILNERTDFS